MAPRQALDFQEIVDKAIKVAFDAFRVEFSKLISDKFNELGARIDHLEAVVNTLQQEGGTSGGGGGIGTSAGRAGYAAAVITGRGRDMAGNRAALTAMHLEMADKQKRAKNIIITGLVAQTDKTDAELFEQLCEDHLPVKPAFVRSSCRRLGRPQSGKTQPLLITLDSTVGAADVLSSARDLRKSQDNVVKTSVFINADMTLAEAQAAYELRVRRRDRRAATARVRENNSHSGSRNPSPRPSASPRPSTPTVTASSLQPSSSSTASLCPSAADFVPGATGSQGVVGGNTGQENRI